MNSPKQDISWQSGEAVVMRKTQNYPTMSVDNNHGYYKIGNYVYTKGSKIRYLNCIPSAFPNDYKLGQLPDMTLLIFEGADKTYGNTEITCIFAEGPNKGQKVVLTLPTTIAPEESTKNIMCDLCPNAWHEFEIGPEKAEEERKEREKNTTKNLITVLALLGVAFFLTCISGGLLGIPILIALILFLIW